MTGSQETSASRKAAAVRRLAAVERQRSGRRNAETGLLIALAIFAVAVLGARSGLHSADAKLFFTNLGVLLSVFFGFLSSIWWHQSADIANTAATDDRTLQWAANKLSGSAATTTALSLMAGVFTSVPWRSDATWLCGLGLLVVITMSGDDLRWAARISLSYGLHLRAKLGLSTLAVLFLIFIGHIVFG